MVGLWGVMREKTSNSFFSQPQTRSKNDLLNTSSRSSYESGNASTWQHSSGSKLDKSNTQKCLGHCWLAERQSFPPNPFPGIFVPGKENVHIHSAHETRKNETAIWKEQKSRWVWRGFKRFCSVFIKLVQFSFCYLKPELYGTRKELCNLNEVVQVLILPEEDVFTRTKLQFPGLSSHHFLAMKS